MKVAAAAFSGAGKEKLNTLKRTVTEIEFEVRSEGESLNDWVEKAFETRTALLFVGACGIAVRAVAPFINSKLEDPAVVCMDEKGQFIIPILSGHVGGANELACTIADKIGAVPVITTASDINGSFAIDSFARKHNLEIMNKEGIVKVTSSVLAGKPITVSVKDYPPKVSVNVVITNNPNEAYVDKADLILKRKEYTIGIGCKKNKSSKDIEEAIMSAIKDCNIEIGDIYAIGTIELKENEPGIQEISNKYRIPIISFTADLLEMAQGEFTDSEFVKETVGVGNVCERAAVLSGGLGARLILEKQTYDGITVAIAIRWWGQEDY